MKHVTACTEVQCDDGTGREQNMLHTSVPEPV